MGFVELMDAIVRDFRTYEEPEEKDEVANNDATDEDGKKTNTNNKKVEKTK